MKDLQLLWSLAKSSSVDDRRECLERLRSYVDSAPLLMEADEVFDIARHLVSDVDSTCRWQSLIVIGDYIRGSPSKVWDVVCEHSHQADDDMLNALATLLLEHLLEHHFEATYARIEEGVGFDRSAMRSMLKRCWRFGQGDEQWERLNQLFKLDN